MLGGGTLITLYTLHNSSLDAGIIGPNRVELAEGIERDGLLGSADFVQLPCRDDVELPPIEYEGVGRTPVGLGVETEHVDIRLALALAGAEAIRLPFHRWADAENDVGELLLLPWLYVGGALDLDANLV